MEWFKRARYEGRGEKPYKEDDITFCGWEYVHDPGTGSGWSSTDAELSRKCSDMKEVGGYEELTVFKGCKTVEPIRKKK